jgi:methionyl-tRNA formyltransferase
MSKTSLRVIFAGTPEFSACHLKALIESEHQLLAVYTQPDRPAGRGKKLHASAVKQLAIAHDLPLYQPASLKEDAAQQELFALDADVMIVVAYGLILPQVILDSPAMGCLNVHASLLPRWRGAAPIQRAIAAGDSTTGLTIMQMDAGLDTGDMLATVNTLIGPTTNAASLHDELALVGPPLLLNVLSQLPDYQQKRRQQPEEGTTYAHKILKAEAEINWADSASNLDKKIRAFNPFPVCYSTLGEERVRIWQARPINEEKRLQAPGTIIRADEQGILISCAQGQLLIDVLQLPGGKALTAKQIMQARHAQFAPGLAFNATPEGAQ